ncbi:MAG: hypothetical protein H0X39_12605 [Actinobacteria bacterium]|nr:hypothetical protein [Actinomycetota bacterium]
MTSSKQLPFPEVEVTSSTLAAVSAEVGKELGNGKSESPSLSLFRDKEFAAAIIAGAQSVLADLIREAQEYLDDEEVGAACVRTPDSSAGDAYSVFLRTTIMLAFTSSKEVPLADDKLNRTPFTIYGASDDNKAAMESAGLRNFAPDAVLGFHNDGAFADNRVYLPALVGLQNIVLNYRRPGRFYWIPFSLWTEGISLADSLRDHSTRISTTPIAHREGGGGEVVVDRQAVIETPIIWRGNATYPTVFLNGEPLADSEKVFRDIQKSLARNQRRYYTAQSPTRLTLIRNDRGVHARDVLQEPMASGSTASRMLLRTISASGIAVPGVVTAS